VAVVTALGGIFADALIASGRLPRLAVRKAMGLAGVLGPAVGFVVAGQTESTGVAVGCLVGAAALSGCTAAGPSTNLLVRPVSGREGSM
jgi:hypothetical protein